MKRFTETAKWSDPWYRSLEPRLKCLWAYLCDACDCAGIIKIDWALASFVIGESVSEADLALFEGRVEAIANGYHWLPKFVCYQHRTLSMDCAPQRSVLERLDAFGLRERVTGSRQRHKVNEYSRNNHCA